MLSFVAALLLSSGHRPTALGAVATASQNPDDAGGGYPAATATKWAVHAARSRRQRERPQGSEAGGRPLRGARHPKGGCHHTGQTTCGREEGDAGAWPRGRECVGLCAGRAARKPERKGACPAAGGCGMVCGWVWVVFVGGSLRGSWSYWLGFDFVISTPVILNGG